MIDDFQKIENLFAEIDSRLAKKINVYIIGGAVLLRRGMKAATKDIDLVLATEHDFRTLQEALRKSGFVPQIPGKEYARMNLSQIFAREDFRIDAFAKTVCARFSLSKGMMARAEQVLSLPHSNIFLCANEDLFLFKTMTEREGDSADCISMATTQNLDWDIILQELQAQMQESKQDVWVTWVGERLDILVERGVDIPIMKDVDRLREEFYDQLEKRQA